MRKFSALTKKCPMCKEEKPVSAYSLRNTKGRTGPVGRCKPCCAAVRRVYYAKKESDPNYVLVRRTAAKKWREDNPELGRAMAKRNRFKYRDRKLAANRKWHKDNAEKVKKRALAYRAENAAARSANRRSEAFRKKRAEYWLKNPGKKSAICAARRARVRAAMPAWADRRAIEDIYQDARELSDATDMIWHVDHIIPIRHRLVCGLHIATNLQILTADANKRKSNRFEPIQEVNT